MAGFAHTLYTHVTWCVYGRVRTHFVHSCYLVRLWQGSHTLCTLMLLGASMAGFAHTLYTHVTWCVYGRVRTHFVHSCYLVRLWQGSHTLCTLMLLGASMAGFAHTLYTHVTWCVYGTRGARAQKFSDTAFMHSDVFEIVSRIIFHFHPELPHM